MCSPTSNYLTISQLRAKLGGRAPSNIQLDLAAGLLPTPVELDGHQYWCPFEVEDYILMQQASGHRR